MKKVTFKAIPDYLGWKITKVSERPTRWFDAESPEGTTHYGSWTLDRLRAHIETSSIYGEPLPKAARALKNCKDAV